MKKRYRKYYTLLHSTPSYPAPPTTPVVGPRCACTHTRQAWSGEVRWILFFCVWRDFIKKMGSEGRKLASQTPENTWISPLGPLQEAKTGGLGRFQGGWPGGRRGGSEKWKKTVIFWVFRTVFLTFRGLSPGRVRLKPIPNGVGGGKLEKVPCGACFSVFSKIYPPALIFLGGDLGMA